MPSTAIEIIVKNNPMPTIALEPCGALSVLTLPRPTSIKLRLKSHNPKAVHPSKNPMEKSITKTYTRRESGTYKV